MLDQLCNYSKQCRDNVATLYCTKNRRRKASRLTSPLVAVSVVEKLNQESMYGLSAGIKKSGQCREVAVVEMRPLVEVRLYAPARVKTTSREDGDSFPLTRRWVMVVATAGGDFHELSRFSVFALV